MFNFKKGFREMPKDSDLKIERGDRVCLVFQRPKWIPSKITGFLEWLLKKRPSLKYLKMSHAGEEHQFDLIESENDGTYIYLYYVAKTNAIPIIIVVGLCAVVLGGLLGSLSTIGVSKVGGSVKTSIGLGLGLVIALAILFVVIRAQRS